MANPDYYTAKRPRNDRKVAILLTNYNYFNQIPTKIG